jgi:hypothetical protein
MFPSRGFWIGAALAAAGAAVPPRFVDVAPLAGLIGRTTIGGERTKDYVVETTGGGVALLDADGDGWLDVFLVNGGRLAGPAEPSRLFRNRGDGSFADASAGAGLDKRGWGQGACAGDYDNDGRTDLYVTYLEGDRLFHNEGGGKFRDVTAAAGIRNADFGSSAAWLDYDKDGKLDLFVANYVQWNPKSDLWCSLDGASKSYCTPESYKGTASRLFRNLGGGKFADAGVKAGVADPASKSLGVAVLDYDGDTWPDLFVANDTQPNKLYRNLRNGSFREEGLAAGVAFGEDGVARGAMGVDAADYDRSGRPHLIVANFSNQMLGLYRNEGKGLFVDEAPRSTVGRSSLLTLAFGAFFFDYDLDSHLDIFTLNGHIDEEISRVQPKVAFRQAPHLFRNLGKGRFEEVTAKAGQQLNRPIVGRGAAYGDYDQDGDLDLLLTTNHGPAYLYRNDGGNRNNWLRVKLTGSKSNRDGIGAVVRVSSPSGGQWQMVRSGSSYCSSSELAVTFGLGKDTEVSSLEVDWPSGARSRLTGVKPNQLMAVEEK